MSTVYSALALAVLAVNLAAGIVGSVSWAGHRPSLAFWYLLRAGQFATMAFVVFAAFVYLGGHRADDSLHYLYVFLPVVASFLAELIRGGAAGQELAERLDPEPETGAEPLSATELNQRFAELPPDQQEQIGLAIVRRETGIMTVACLVTTFLIWRALVTTAGLF